MRVNGFEVVGRSVSGYATAVALPEYGLSFDCGMATHDSVQCEHVAVTHGHLDHFGGVARHAYLRGMTGMAHSQFLVPPWLVQPTHQMMQFWAEVQEARKAPYGVTAVSPDKRVNLGKGRFLRAFTTDHRVKSQGYVLVEERKRLKPEFVGVDGRELGRLRREGAAFEETFEVPLVGFTGDTRARLFNTFKPEAKVFLVECTFLDDSEVTVEEARKKGHVHLSELAARPEVFEKVEALVLCHFSKRHTNREVEAAVAQLPQELREKTTFLPVAR
jgi:ribonuclease Z